MYPLNTIERLDSFVDGLARIASLHGEERFWFSAVALPRGETPMATLLAAHKTLVRPHAGMLEGRLPRLDLLDRTGIEDVLSDWFLRHVRPDGPTESRDRICESINDVYEGSEMLLGGIEASYAYRLDPQIYNDLRQEMIDQQSILLLGPTSAVLLRMHVTPR